MSAEANTSPTAKLEQRYLSYLQSIVSYLVHSGKELKEAELAGNRLLSRILMLYFIQEMEWLAGDKRFLHWYLDQYQKSHDTNTFHSKWLKTLLFGVMNKPPCARAIDQSFPENVLQALRSIPFLNHLLFEADSIPELGVDLPDSILCPIIEEFATFDFCLAEYSSESEMTRINPSILSSTYESIAIKSKTTKGVVYTPKAEADLMCRLALYQFQISEKFNGFKQSDIETGPELQKRDIRHQLLSLVFSSIDKYAITNNGDSQFVKTVLSRLRLVDPACGSGDLLIPMLYVLIELRRKMGLSDNFESRAQIVLDCIYGVDQDEWALFITQFRLWLVIAQGVEPPLSQPILPNVSINLKRGDSIIETINGNIISFNCIRGISTQEAKAKLDDFEKLRKKVYFSPPPFSIELDEQAHKIVAFYLAQHQETMKLNPHALEVVRTFSPDSNEAAKDNHFAWDLAFPHIMLRGGFSIVITNPPYIRSEQIAKNAQYKQNLHEYVERHYEASMSSRSDLYVFFFLKSLEILKHGGCFVLLTSNSWLDVDFGTRLQEVLLSNAQLNYIIDNAVSRSFAKAAINTAITIGTRYHDIECQSGKTTFLSFNKAYDDYSLRTQMARVLLGTSNSSEVGINGEIATFESSEIAKRVSFEMEALRRIGGGKWGQYLRAPAVYFKVLDQGAHLLKPLSEIAEIRRGITSGANDFFYLPKPGNSNRYFFAKFDSKTGSLFLHLLDEHVEKFIAQGMDIKSPMFHIEKEYWMHRVDGPIEHISSIYPITFEQNSFSWVPNYIVKGPKEIKSISIEPSDLKHVVLMVHENKHALQKGIKEYIWWGENFLPEDGVRFPDRPTCQSRRRWYDLGFKERPDLIWIKGVWERHVVPFSRRKCYIDQQLYGLQFKDQFLMLTALGFLNSTLTAMFSELNGRSNFGEGVLWMAAYEVGGIPALSESNVELIESIDKLLCRSARSVLEEIKSHRPGGGRLERVDKHRRYVDKLIMETILGLSDEEQSEIYRTVVDLVATRLRKAKSPK